MAKKLKIVRSTTDNWGGIWVWDQDGKQYAISRTSLHDILLNAEITNTKQCKVNTHILGLKLERKSDA